MNRVHRVTLCSLFFIVMGSLNVARVITQNDQSYQDHPVAAIAGTLTPAFLVAVGLYWFLALFRCSGSLANPVKLPETVLSSLKVKGGPRSPASASPSDRLVPNFTAEVYNGSPKWHICSLTMTITAKKETRTFELSLPSDASVKSTIAPLSSGGLQVDVGSLLLGVNTGEYSTCIVGGFGFRKS